MNATDTKWAAPDGTTFPALRWGNWESARAAVLCTHGMGGSPADFDPFGQAMARLGVVSLAVCVRGQGLDPEPRRRGAFLDPGIIAGDIEAASAHLRDCLPGVPVFFCGESLGALLGVHALTNGWQGPRFDGVILSAPVVALARDTPPLARRALRFLARVFPGGRLRPSWFVTGGRNAPKTSRDEDWVARQKRGPQYIPAFSFGVLEGVGRLMETMPSAAQRLYDPVLVLAAGRDVFVRPGQVLDWFHLLSASDKTFLEFPEAYHVLWNDWDRQSVLEAAGRWVTDRIKPAASLASPTPRGC